MPMSSRATSGRARTAAASACSPSCTTSTQWPSRRSSNARLSAASTLSSATRMRRGADAATAGSGGCSAAGCTDCGSGRCTTNSLPRPGPSLYASTLPPCIATMPRTSARPMPRPPSERSIELVTCENISNTRVSEAASRPMPSSLTWIAISSPAGREVQRRMWPPRSVYFAALFSRLPSTWARRTGSASTQTGDGGSSSCNECERASIAGREVSTAAAITPASATRSRRSTSVPRVMRDTSSRSSSSSAMWFTWRSMISVLQCSCSADAVGARAIRAACRIGASGLRSSCASVARNSSLRRSAAWRSCSAWSRSSSSDAWRASSSNSTRRVSESRTRDRQ